MKKSSQCSKSDFKIFYHSKLWQYCDYYEKYCNCLKSKRGNTGNWKLAAKKKAAKNRMKNTRLMLTLCGIALE